MTAESLRRAGNPSGAVDLCRDALTRFPGHLSARVTLGWALLDLGKWSEAQQEFETVRKQAPDNLAAIRGLAKLHTLHDAEAFTDADLHEPDESRDIDPIVEPASAPLPVQVSIPAPAPVRWAVAQVPAERDPILTNMNVLDLDAMDLDSLELDPMVFDPIGQDDPEPTRVDPELLDLAAYDLSMCRLGLDPEPAPVWTRYVPKFKSFEEFEPVEPDFQWFKPVPSTPATAGARFEHWQGDRLTECA